MPAEFESGAFRGEPAWHHLGHVFGQDEAVNTGKMLELSNLAGWNIRLEATSGYFPTNYNFVTEPYLVVRDNPFGSGEFDVLGSVGERYEVVQNESLFAFGDSILDGGGQWESAGSLKDGRVVFGSLVIDRDIVVGAGDGGDLTKVYLLVSTSHNGSTSVQASITPVRVVCANTLAVALAGTKQSFKVRHTTTVEDKMLAAREALALTFKYADAFEAEANALFEVETTKDEFFKIIERMYPQPEKDAKGAQKKWDNKADTLMGIFTGADKDQDTTGSIGGTAWGAFNALTERLDYFRTARSGNTENQWAAASGFDLATKNEKEKALAVVKDFADVKAKRLSVLV